MKDIKAFLLNYFRALHHNPTGNFTFYLEEESGIRMRFEQEKERLISFKLICHFLAKKHIALKKMSEGKSLYGKSNEEIFLNITKEVFNESKHNYQSNQVTIMKNYIYRNIGTILDRFTGLTNSNFPEQEIEEFIKSTAHALTKQT